MEDQTTRPICSFSAHTPVRPTIWGSIPLNTCVSIKDVGRQAEFDWSTTKRNKTNTTPPRFLSVNLSFVAVVCRGGLGDGGTDRRGAMPAAGRPPTRSQCRLPKLPIRALPAPPALTAALMQPVPKHTLTCLVFLTTENILPFLLLSNTKDLSNNPDNEDNITILPLHSIPDVSSCARHSGKLQQPTRITAGKCTLTRSIGSRWRPLPYHQDQHHLESGSPTHSVK